MLLYHERHIQLIRMIRLTNFILFYNREVPIFETIIMRFD